MYKVQLKEVTEKNSIKCRKKNLNRVYEITIPTSVSNSKHFSNLYEAKARKRKLIE